MLVGAVFAWFIPEVQYKRNRKNIPLEKLALGRQEKEFEMETITSETVQRMGHQPGPQTSNFVDPRTDPPANSTSPLQEASQ